VYFQSVAPLDASKATISPAVDEAYITPLATVTALKPRAARPDLESTPGTGTCQLIEPVRASSADTATLVLDAGATASGTVIQPGGTFDLQAGGALSGSVAFAGGGTLQIDGTTMTAATISGFGTGGRIDLTGTPSTLPAARS